MHWTYKAFTEDLHFCLYAAPCPKSTPGLLSNFPLTSATFSLAAFYIFFQMESLLRLPLVSLMFPFSGHRRSFSIVFLLSGRIWQLFEFSCTVLCCWSCFFQKIVIILRINLVWKVSTFWMMVVVTFHDSEPYRRTPNKVCIEYPDFGLGPDVGWVPDVP